MLGPENPAHAGQNPDYSNPRLFPDRLDDQAIRDRFKIIRNPASIPGDRERALNEVVMSSLGLIYYVIERYKPSGIPAQELIGEGFETLLGCIRNYNPDFISEKTQKPTTFVNYFARSLILALKRPSTYEQTTLPFHMARHLNELISNMTKTYDDLCQKLGRYPTIDEWYEATAARYEALPGEKTFEAINAYFFEGNFLSLNREVDTCHINPEDLSPITQDASDQIPAPLEEDPFEQISNKLLNDELMTVLNSLPPYQREIIMLRYGFYGEPITYAVVARLLKVAPETVINEERQALRKLRHPYRTRHLREYLE